MNGPAPNVAAVRGLCPPAFGAVREAFEANFAEGRELGARFALAIEGEIVVDLMGGWADRAQTRPFADDTLTPVFSTTKAMAACMIARLVDQGGSPTTSRVAEVWPEFGGGRQGRAHRRAGALAPGRPVPASPGPMAAVRLVRLGRRSARGWRR